jgi:hypothetical protein
LGGSGGFAVGKPPGDVGLVYFEEGTFHHRVLPGSLQIRRDPVHGKVGIFNPATVRQKQNRSFSRIQPFLSTTHT